MEEKAQQWSACEASIKHSFIFLRIYYWKRIQTMQFKVFYIIRIKYGYLRKYSFLQETVSSSNYVIPAYNRTPAWKDGENIVILLICKIIYQIYWWIVTRVEFIILLEILCSYKTKCLYTVHKYKYKHITNIYLLKYKSILSGM